MMSRLLPYPLLAASLLVMWLLLNGFSAGHLVLGAAIALLALLFWAATRRPARVSARSSGAAGQRAEPPVLERP